MVSNPDRGQITVQDGRIKRVPSQEIGSAALAASLTAGRVRAGLGPSVKVTGTVSENDSIAIAVGTAIAEMAPRPDPTQMHWRPLTGARRITFEGTSFVAVRRAFEEAFGEFPLRLAKADLAAVRAMAAVAGEGRAPYDQVAEALLRHGDVELGVE